ncbi:MAG: DUF1360 domain-containing protein [bacterium]
MKTDSKYVWYMFDIIAFVVIIFVNVWLWNKILYPVDWVSIMTPFKLFIFGLATYRLADIITTETITDVIRAPFKDYKKEENHQGIWRLSKYGFRGFFGTLLSCPSCMGVWVAMVLFYFYVFFPTWASALMIIMALTGLERFFSKFYNFFDDIEKTRC